MQARRRVKQTTSLQDRLSEFVSCERTKAEGMPKSDDRTSQEVRQAEVAANIERWANSPKLQSPK